MAYSTMNTVPAADVESETPLLQRDVKINAKTLVGGAAAAAFALGILAATAATSSKPAGMKTTNLVNPFGGHHITLQATQYRGGSDWKCLDIPGGEDKIQYNIDNGIGLQIWECGDYNNGWTPRVHGMMGGWSMIIEWKDSGFCIDAWSGGEGGKEGQQLGMWPCQDISKLYPDQQLFWDHDGAPGYVGNMDTIYLGYSSDPVLCMDVAGGPNVDLSDPPLYQDGMAVQAYECNGDYAANQQWTFSD